MHCLVAGANFLLKVRPFFMQHSIYVVSAFVVVPLLLALEKQKRKDRLSLRVICLFEVLSHMRRTAGNLSVCFCIHIVLIRLLNLRLEFNLIFMLFLQAIRHEAFTHMEGEKEFVQIDPNDLYPYLLVNVGSGVSIIKVFFFYVCYFFHKLLCVVAP